MAKHEFGIIERAPSPGERYDTYEPERYGCISVPDEDLEGLFADLRINVYWHTLDRSLDSGGHRRGGEADPSEVAIVAGKG